MMRLRKTAQMRQLITAFKLCAAGLLPLALLSACAVGGASFVAPDPAPSDSGVIYIYRPTEIQGSALTLQIYDGANPFLQVKNGQFIKGVTSPGHHLFTTKTGAIDKGVELDVEAGQTYFIRYGIRHGWFQNTLYLSRAYPEDAVAELKECCKSGGE